jgi:hypothetical protein
LLRSVPPKHHDAAACRVVRERCTSPRDRERPRGRLSPRASGVNRGVAEDQREHAGGLAAELDDLIVRAVVGHRGAAHDDRVDRELLPHRALDEASAIATVAGYQISVVTLLELEAVADAVAARFGRRAIRVAAIAGDLIVIVTLLARIDEAVAARDRQADAVVADAAITHRVVGLVGASGDRAWIDAQIRPRRVRRVRDRRAHRLLGADGPVATDIAVARDTPGPHDRHHDRNPRHHSAQDRMQLGTTARGFETERRREPCV